jgi:putative ABC transport system ATP-binding protein
MIRLEQIVKTYNKGKSNEFKALKGISIEIQDGEMVAIIGQSGAGKSTLLHILAGIDGFEGGSYHVGNLNIGKLSEKQLAKFRNEQAGIVMQDFALIEDYTVTENLMVPLIFGKIPKKKRMAMIDKVLEKIGITELKNKQVNQLSGGQKQRVAIARAVINSPQFILADEPTGALDSRTSRDIMQVFKELNQAGHTVIIVTHDMNVAEKCDRKIEIKDGEISPTASNR